MSNNNVSFKMLGSYITFMIVVLLRADLSHEKLIGDSDKTYLAPFLNKKYELVSSDDNFDDVMKALGIGILQRNLAKVAKPVMELKENGREYILSSNSSFKDTITKFKIGEEFKDVTPDGRKVSSIFMQDKNKLIQVQKGNKTTSIVREFFPEEVLVTVEVDGIVSVRKYKLVQG